MKPWAEVQKDPYFMAAPKAEQEQMRTAYLAEFEKTDDFKKLPVGEQEQVKSFIRQSGPSLPDTTIAAAKAAGQLIGHSMRLGKEAIAGLTERGGGALGEAADKVTKKLDLPRKDASDPAYRTPGTDALDMAMNPMLHSREIVERFTQAGLAAEKQLRTPPSPEERREHPIATALHITRPLRAFSAFIEESLPEFTAYQRWEARSKLGALKNAIDDTVAQARAKAQNFAEGVAPTEPRLGEEFKEPGVGRLAARAAIETAADLGAALGEFAGSMTTPSGFLMNEAMLRGGAAAGRAAGGAVLEKMVATAPEAALKAALPVTAADMKAAAQGALAGRKVAPQAWRAADEHVLGTVKQVMEPVAELVRAGEVPKSAFNATARAVADRMYEVEARKLYRLQFPAAWRRGQPGEPAPMGREAQLGEVAPHPSRGASDSGLLENAAVVRRPQPIDPEAVAVNVLAAGVQGPETAALARRFPWVYSSAADLADVPQAARARYAEWSGKVARAVGLPPGAPVTAEVLARAVTAGTVNYLELADLDRALFEAEATAQGAMPDTLEALYADAQEAAARPAEAVAVQQARKEAVAAFQGAKAAADEITRLEALRAADGALPEGWEGQPQPPAQSGELAVSQAPEAPLPARTEAVDQAVTAGASAEDALALHRAEALAAQEAGTLDPAAAMEYAEVGDDAFDPAALEAEAVPFPDTQPHPGEMTPEEFAAAFPDAPPEVQAEMARAFEDEREAFLRAEHRREMALSGAQAQPIMDLLRSMPIGEEWVKDLGLTGEFLHPDLRLKARGVIVPGRGEGSSISGVDAAVSRAVEAGLLPENATPSDLAEALRDEVRKGTKAEASRAAGIPLGKAGKPGRGGRAARAGEAPGAPSKSGEPLPAEPRRVPLDKSVTENPVFVKALEQARPVLEPLARGGDVADPDFVLKVYKEVAQEVHDLKNQVMVVMAKGTEAQQKELGERIAEFASKMAAIDRLGHIAYQPEKALAYYAAKDAGQDTAEIGALDDPLLDEMLTRTGEQGEEGGGAAMAVREPGAFDDSAQGSLFDNDGNVNPEAMRPEGDPEPARGDDGEPPAMPGSLPLDEGAAPKPVIPEGAGSEPFKSAEKGLTDVGQQLWYNRRNFTGKGITWADVKDLNSTLKVLEVQKAKVWPRPDYEQLVADGMSPFTAHMVKQVYDSISTKPVSPGTAADEVMRAYVEEVQRIKEAVFKWARDTQAQKGLLDNMVAAAKARAGGTSIISQMGAAFKSDTSLLDALYPLKPGTKARFHDSENVDRARLVGGNKLVDAIQFDTTSGRAAIEAINQGWPKPQEAWQKRFDIRVSPAGSRSLKNGKPHVSEKETYYIVGKGRRYILADDLPSMEAAVAKAKELAAAKKSTKVEAEEALADFKREGPPHRPSGLDVKPEDLQREFGFRGVNFGNYTNQGERQTFTNHAYDALRDLADIVGLPPQALSLDGVLGLAYGAQGRGGKYAAHFVPGVNEINLTKDSGAGSLAHEWAHALDHYFAVQAGELYAKAGDPYLTHHVERGMFDTASKLRPEGALAGLRPEIKKAFFDIVEAMKKRKQTMEEAKAQAEMAKKMALKRLDSWLNSFRQRLEHSSRIEADAKVKALADFDGIAERMRRGDLGEGTEKLGTSLRAAYYPVSQATGELRRLFKDTTGYVPSPDDLRSLDASATYTRTLLDAERHNKAVEQSETIAKYRADARKLDADKVKGYWSRETEMFARAFQSYVLDKLAEKARRNDYLTRPQYPTEKYQQAMGADPYPRGEERARINTAFDALIAALKTKPTDRGIMVYDAPPAPAFYSRLQRDVEAKLGPKATVEQVRALLRDQKKEEVEWSGIEEFLAGKEKVTKAELLDFLRANQVEVREVMKGGPEGKNAYGHLRVRLDDIERIFSRRGYVIGLDPGGMGTQIHVETVIDRNPDGSALSGGDDVGLDDLPEDLRPLAEEYRDGHTSLEDASYSDQEPDGTQFSQYTLPGGENYRELLLTLPEKAPTITPHGRVEELQNGRFIVEAPGLQPKTFETLAEAEAERMRLGERFSKKDNNFRSSHFDEPNVLAHVRFNDRVDADGARVLFIEEVQSDWHQKGRREGYQKTSRDVRAEPGEHAQQWNLYDKSSGELLAPNVHGETAEQAISNLRLYRSGEVPDAPFKKTWHEFALKRMLRYAAENGYDKVAWTTGAQQADRYDLSKTVDAIFYWKNPNGTYDLMVRPAMQTERGTRARIDDLAEQLPPEKLADYVGKDVADKIISGKGRAFEKYPDSRAHGSRIIDGVDLEVGGEGMKGFYDEMVPAFLSKFGKKFGMKVGTAEVETTGAIKNKPQVQDYKDGLKWLKGGDEIYYELSDEPGQFSSIESVEEWKDLHEEDEEGFGGTYYKLKKGEPPIEHETVHAVEVTPELREAALTEGFSLFDRAERAYADESAKAYGRGADLAAISEAVQLDLDLGGKTGLAQKLAADGKVDYRGFEVKGIEDVAEVIASRRHPLLEHNNFVLVRQGVVVGHMVYTSGMPNAVLVTPEDLRSIAAEADRLGADEVWTGHNHPSGNPTPSMPDKAVDARLRKELGPRYKGMVVTDGEEFFSIEMAVEAEESYYEGRVRMKSHRFAQPKEDFTAGRGPRLARPSETAGWSKPAPDQAIRATQEVVAQAAKDGQAGSVYTVLLLDARGHLMGMEHLPKDANVPRAVGEAVKAKGAVNAIVVSPTPLIPGGEPFPSELLEAVHVNDKGDFQVLNTGRKGRSAYGELSSIRVAEESAFHEPFEEGPRFMGANGMQPEDLARALQETGVKVGSQVTARVNLKGVPRLTKGTVMGVDAKGVRLLVRFGEGAAPVVVRPEDTVELRRKPAAREALEAAQRAPQGPSQPVKTTVHESVGLAREKLSRQVSEQLALREALRKEAAGARGAAREGQKKLRHEIRRAVEQGNWEEATRRKIVELAKEALDPKDRGALLTKVAQARDQADLLDAFWYIEAKADATYRKDLVNDIKVLAGRIMRSKTFPLSIKKAIEERLEDVRLENWNAKTLDKIAADKALVEELGASGEDVVVPRRLLDRIAKLAKQPLNELPVSEVEAIHEFMRQAYANGKDLRDNLHAMAEADKLQALYELTEGPEKIAGLRSRAMTEGAKRAPLDAALTFKQEHANAYLKALDMAQRARMVMTPAAMMYELIDGREGGPLRRFVYDKLDAAQSAFLVDDFEGYLKKRDEMLNKWGDIPVEEAERVGVVLQAAQEGGREKLHQLGIDDERIDAIIKRTDPAYKKAGQAAREDEMLAWLREAIQYRTDEMMRVDAAVNNREVPLIENYFSMLTDWERTREDATIEQMVGPGFSGYRRQVEQKFLKERVTNAKQKIILDPFKVIDAHIQRKLWFIHTSEALKDINSFVKTPEFRAAAGDLGAQLVDWHLDAMARMGGVEGARRLRILGRLRRGLGAAAITFNPGSALIQPSSLADGAARIGGKAMSRGLGLLTDSTWQAIFDDLSPKLKYRGEGRNLYTDVMPGTRMDKMEKIGGAPIRVGDHAASRAVFGGAYSLWHEMRGLKMDKAAPNKEAAKFAQGVVDQSQVSPHLVDLPLIMSGGRLSGNADIDRALAQFNLFMMGRQSHLIDDILGKDWKRGDRRKAAQRFGWILGAMSYEIGMKHLLAVMASWFGAKKADEFFGEDGRNFARNMLVAGVSSFVPIVPGVIQSILYGQDTIAAMSIPRKAVTGGAQVAQGGGAVAGAAVGAAVGGATMGSRGAMLGGAFGAGIGMFGGGPLGGKPLKATKGVVDVLTALAAFKGVPGSMVAGRMVRRSIPKDEE